MAEALRARGQAGASAPERSPTSAVGVREVIHYRCAPTTTDPQHSPTNATGVRESTSAAVR